MEAIAKGILSGLGYGLLLGPLFFMNIRLTLSHGFRHGLALVAGAFTSDLTLVLACWWGASQLQAISNDKSFQNWFGLACGLLLLIFGAVALFARQRDLSKELEGGAAPVAKKRYAYLQGLLINFTNPSNWLFWLSVATIAKSEAPADNPYYAKIFMFSALLALCSTDLTKVLLAHKIGGWLKPGVPEKIVRFAGGILVCLSSWLLWSVAERW